MFLGHFWAYVGQPHGHIGWATSINSTYPIHEIFIKKFWELAILKNVVFFSRSFWSFFFWKKNVFSHDNKSNWLARMGQNFDQAKRDNAFWPTPKILKGSVWFVSFSVKNYICLRNNSYFIFIEKMNKIFHSFRTIFGNFGHCDAFLKKPLLTTSQISLGHNCTFMHVRDMTS